MGVVVFDPVFFKTRYPEFLNVSDAQLLRCFDEAVFILSNTGASPVQNEHKRLLLLCMLTAHIAQLSGALSTGGALPVGRTSSATEGSVSIALDFPSTRGQEWFAQTQYGAAYWQSILSYRSFKYISCLTAYK